MPQRNSFGGFWDSSCSKRWISFLISLGILQGSFFPMSYLSEVAFILAILTISLLALVFEPTSTFVIPQVFFLGSWHPLLSPPSKEIEVFIWSQKGGETIRVPLREGQSNYWADNTGWLPVFTLPIWVGEGYFLVEYHLVTIGATSPSSLEALDTSLGSLGAVFDPFL